jgi:enolase
VKVTASVPSGTSRGSFEAVEVRDGGERLMGLGVHKAVESLQTIIAPALIGQEPEVHTLDSLLIELDGTENKSRLGANAMLAASIAVCKAQALMLNMFSYELISHICQKESVVIPFGLFNIMNGGVHANNQFLIQEFMIIPTGAQTFRESFEQAVTISHRLRAMLMRAGLSTAVGAEGGFAPMGITQDQALDLIMEAIATSGISSPDDVVLALDVAASELFDEKTQTYQWCGKRVDADELLEIYTALVERYPIYLIEDPYAQTDYSAWKQMMLHLADQIHIVGDDIFSTNVRHIEYGIKQGIADAAIIKPNQIGTVLESLRAIDMCQQNDIATIVSHRSGETNDDFIVDLAVGASSGFIKAGGCSRGERMAKYNRLLAIEDDLLFSSLDH